MDREQLQRENYKARLDCTDEWLDGIFKIADDATTIGIRVDLDAFVSFIEKEIAIRLYGDPNSKTDLFDFDITIPH